MEKNMQHYLTILTGDEPLNILVCPLFLPISIGREYNHLWTKNRMQQIIDAARVKNIAIEINDLVRVPHEEFILMAKDAGLKFTFGSDTRDQKTGRLDYCKYIAAKCGLTMKDFYIPERKLDQIS
jgi:histidinol phosphatase-like PHP family hydrolase